LLLSFVGCTTLTEIDWSRIPAPEPSGGSGGGSGVGNTGNVGGEPANDGGEAGQGGAGAQAGESAGGEANLGGDGQGGAGPDPGAGTGGSAGMGGGVGGAGGTGVGGMSGSAGTAGSGGGDSVAPKCNTYPTAPGSINLTGKTVMFDGGAQADGAAWGGRQGLDAKCAAAATTLGLNKLKVHALLATTPGVDLTGGDNGNFVDKFDVPGFAIVSPLGITIADGGVTLTTFKKSLICAGVVQANVETWLTGVRDGGAFDPTLACQSWALRTDSTIDHAGVGLTDTTNALFHDHLLADHWVSCNTTNAHVLCLAWEDAPP
jgi:hypothetical protein